MSRLTRAIETPQVSDATRLSPNRLIETWALYRIALSLALIALIASPLDINLPSSAAAQSLLMLNVGISGLILTLNRAQVLPLNALVALHLAHDFGFASLVSYSAGGMGGGMSSLFIVPVAMGSLFLPRYASPLPAAMASLFLLAIEYRLDTVDVSHTAAWAPAGLFGALLFIVSFVANFIALRARLDEGIARAAAQSLGQMRQLAAQVVDRMQSGVVVTDLDGNILLNNETSRRLLIHPHDFRPLAQRERDLWCAATRFLANPSAATFDPIRLASGEMIWPQFTRLTGDAPLLVIVIDDPVHLARQRQQARLAGIGQITAGVAHDVRNPLAAINNAAQLLSDAPDDNREQLLNIVVRQTQRLNRVVERIHDLSQPIQPHPQSIQLADFLQEWQADYLSTHSAPGQISIAVPDGCSRAEVDPEHLAEILDNLADNVRQHAKPPIGQALQVWLNASESKDSLQLRFTDNGTVPLPAASDKPFEAFSGEGRMGLGLTLCRELIQANGGDIQLCQATMDESHNGTCFALTLRLAPEVDTQ